jgi:hypothetical protein
MARALIRATHPVAFRAGEWAEIAGTASLPGYPDGERPCYLVRFSDGAADFWIIDDDAEPGYGYEFLMVSGG